MLLTAMDTSCVRSRLLSSTSTHKHLVDAVLHAISPDSTTPTCFTKVTEEHSHEAVFWPTLQTVITLLDRLESRFWQLTGKNPASVCSTILFSPYFLYELNNWVMSSNEAAEEVPGAQAGFDDFMSCSQVVYDFGSKRNVSALEKLPGSLQKNKLSEASGTRCNILFSWVVPFINSLLDYGDVLKESIVNVFLALHNMLHISLSKNSCTLISDKLLEASELIQLPPSDMSSISEPADQILLCLSQLVELLFTKEHYSLLLEVKTHWLPHLVAVAILPRHNLLPSQKPFLCNSPISPFLLSSQPVNGKTTSSHSVCSKALRSILHCSVARTLPNCNRENLVSYLTPASCYNRGKKLSLSCMQRPSHSSLTEAILAVLRSCLAQQDIVGPFLPYKASSQSRSTVVVKKEPSDGDTIKSGSSSYRERNSSSLTPDLLSEGALSYLPLLSVYCIF